MLYCANYPVFIRQNVLITNYRIDIVKMSKSGPETLTFAGLKTKNAKSKKLAKKSQEVPHFVGLSNPFYRQDPVKKKVHVEKSGEMSVKVDQTKLKDTEKDDIMNVLNVEKSKFSSLPKQKKKVPPLKIVRENNQFQWYQLANLSFLSADKPACNNETSDVFETIENNEPAKPLPDEKRKPFKTPKKKMCTLGNCTFCSAAKCGICLNCVDKSRHNKCILQICPRLNRKFHFKSSNDDSDLSFSGPITEGNESIKISSGGASEIFSVQTVPSKRSIIDCTVSSERLKEPSIGANENSSLQYVVNSERCVNVQLVASSESVKEPLIVTGEIVKEQLVLTTESFEVQHAVANESTKSLPVVATKVPQEEGKNNTADEEDDHLRSKESAEEKY